MQFWIDNAMSAKISHGDRGGNFLSLANDYVAEDDWGPGCLHSIPERCR